MYQIKSSINKQGKRQYWFVIKARNGKVLATSETYTTHRAARNGKNACILATLHYKLS